MNSELGFDWQNLKILKFFFRKIKKAYQTDERTSRRRSIRPSLYDIHSRPDQLVTPEAHIGLELDTFGINQKTLTDGQRV